MKTFPRWLIAAGILFLLASLGGGVWFYSSQKIRAYRETETNLQAIAQLKVDQISTWREERLNEAAELMGRPLIAEGIPVRLRDRNPQIESNLRRVFENLREHDRYGDIQVVDASGTTHSSLVGHKGTLDAEMLEILQTTLREGRPALSDLHLDPGEDLPHLHAIVPLYELVDEATRPAGAVILRHEAGEFLFPRIQSWPIPSRTAEILLVRREGDTALFLNELRHRSDAALRFRIPLTERGNPAVEAALGGEGVFRGKDYRGEEVLSAMTAIPDSPWRLVAKMDSAEALANWRFESFLILSLLLGFVLVATVTAAVLWQRQEKRNYRALLRAEIARRESEERYHRALDDMMEGCQIVGADWRYVYVNRTVAEQAKRSRDELVGKTMMEVFPGIEQTELFGVLRECMEHRTTRLVENRFVYPDGQIAWFDLRIQPSLEGLFILSIDRTERERAMEALRQSEAHYRALVDNLPQLVWHKDRDSVYVACNLAYARAVGRPQEEIVGKTDFDFYPAELAKKYRGDELRVLEEGVSLDMEEAWEETGRERYLRTIKVPLRNEQGEIFGTLGIAEDITERLRIEQDLRESEMTIRAMSDAAQAGILMMDHDGRISFWNPAAKKIFGFSEAEALGQDLHRLLALPRFQEDFERAFPAFQKSGEGGVVGKTRELVGLRKDGTEFPMELSLSAMKIKDRWNAVGIVHDITERKRAEEALLESEKKFSTAFNTSSLLLGIATLDGKLVEVNQGFCDLTGFSREEILGKTVVDLELMSGPEREGLAAAIRSAGGSVRNFELKFRVRDGGVRDVLYSAEPIFLFGVEHRLATGIEITERKRAEGALEQSRERLLEQQRTLADLIKGDVFSGQDLERTLRHLLEVDARQQGVERVSLWRFVREGAAIRCYDLYERSADRHTSGMELEESDYPSYFAGLLTEEIVVADDAHTHPETREFSEPYLKPLGITSMLDAPVRLHGKLEGVLCHEHAGNPISWSPEQRLFALAIANLITLAIEQHERRRVEEEKDKLQDQLTQAQKMEAVGRLAGGVAHDFNNMLQTILGYAEMALYTLESESPLKQNLSEIRNAAEHSGNLTRQLLAFARRQTAIPRVLDLNDAVESLLKMLRRLIGEDIDLLWSPAHKIGRVKIDPTQVDQILTNLVVNARDAIGGVGKVTIETGDVVFDEAYCADHVGFVPGEFVTLTVSDDGCGMDRETQERIFEPFFTIKKLGEGTGLGLSTVWGIVKQNNGHINVYSEPGEGSAFRIYLPKWENESEEPVIERVKDPPRRGTETILMVEDEGAVLLFGKRVLEDLGYTVLAAGTPAEAIRSMEDETREIHLLLTDVVMPGMNGREMSERLSEQKPGLKVLFMSGYTADVIAHHGVLEEGVRYIQKPFSIEDLATKVRETLDE